MAREGQHSGIDDDTRARAKRFAEDAGMPKPAVAGRAAPKQRVVSKKELEESGLSLRDFLNRERGLTRRGERSAPKLDSDALDRNYVRRDMKSRMDEIDRETQGDVLRAMPDKPRRTPEPLTSTRRPGTNVNYENTDTSDMSMKRGGKVKGYAKGGVTRADGIAKRGHTKGRMI